MDVPTTPPIEQVVQQLDRLIAEMAALRNQVAGLADQAEPMKPSVREADFFGMWADRPDMEGKSSREWLEHLRTQQWTRQ